MIKNIDTEGKEKKIKKYRKKALQKGEGMVI